MGGTEGLSMSRARNPTVIVAPTVRLRANSLGSYPSSTAAVTTRCLVRALGPGRPERARDTVALESARCSAISRMPGELPGPSDLPVTERDVISLHPECA